MLLIVTVWSVCHVSRGQDVTGSVTADSDYYEGSDGDASDDYYENSYEIPLEPAVGVVEGGDELLGEVGENIIEPYDIPINNEIPTEPEEQQETLPLLTEQQGVKDRVEKVEKVEEEDMCRLEAGAGAESILMEIPESRGQDYSQITTPRQLPIMGQVSVQTISHKI